MFEALKKKFAKDKPVKIVRDPIPETGQKVLAVFILLFSIAISFYSGKYLSTSIGYKVQELEQEKEALEEALNSEKVRAKAAEKNLESFQEAVDSVRETNTGLLQRISGLEEDLAYYQRVMNPIKNDKGLRIDTVEIERSADGQRYWINVVLTQLVSKNRNVVKGVLDIFIEGSENGEKKAYSLEELKLENHDLQAKFRFRYYQEISEEIMLPEGFLPEKILLTAKSYGSKAMQIERVEDWPE